MMKDRTSEIREALQKNLSRYGVGTQWPSEVVKELGVSKSQLDRYMAGEGLPSLKTVVRIADFLGVSVTELLDGEDLTIRHATAKPDTYRPRPMVNELVFVDGFYLEVSLVPGTTETFQVSIASLQRGLSNSIFERATVIRDPLHRSHFQRYRGNMRPTDNGIAIHYQNTRIVQDFGHAIVNRADMIKHDLIGIRLTTENSKVGCPFSAPIYMAYVGATLTPSLFRECCGVWSRDILPPRTVPMVERLDRDARCSRSTLRIMR
ncbi:MAG: helix-turn-helix transcriptional regulator [Geminicoccaceae bacterium]|nr:helix-turn-helix transcriptional regulator [Geminicoccaceae bacterium]MCB9944859.1 helix-turn-helix transcriptional regulator [Geminicoccaceae bacterium]